MRIISKDKYEAIKSNVERINVTMSKVSMEIQKRSRLSRTLCTSMFKLRLCLSIFVIMLSVSPITAFAAVTQTFVCSDWYANSGTCSGSNVVLNGTGERVEDGNGHGGNGSSASTNHILYPMLNSHTYYVTFTTTGSGTWHVNDDGQNCGGLLFSGTGNVTDHTITTCSTNGNQDEIVFSDNASFNGSLTYFCISDTAGQCTGGGGGGGGGGGSATTSTSTVDIGVFMGYYGLAVVIPISIVFIGIIGYGLLLNGNAFKDRISRGKFG